MQYQVVASGMSGVDTVHLIGLGYVLAVAIVVWFIMGARNG